jgi:MYXO-CTERM domain-containing protein
VNLEVTGRHYDWARIIDPAGPNGWKLPASSSRTIHVAVHVPATAAPSPADPGADLVLSASSALDLNQRSVAQVYARLDDAAQHADDAALIAAIEGQAAHKGTPSPALPAFLAALALAALLARRRPT